MNITRSFRLDHKLALLFLVCRAWSEIAPDSKRSSERRAVPAVIVSPRPEYWNTITALRSDENTTTALRSLRNACYAGRSEKKMREWKMENGKMRAKRKWPSMASFSHVSSLLIFHSRSFSFPVWRSEIVKGPLGSLRFTFKWWRSTRSDHVFETRGSSVTSDKKYTILAREQGHGQMLSCCKECEM